MTWVAAGVTLAVTLAGTAISYENQQAATNRADQLQAQNIRNQTALEQKAHQDTQQLLQKDQQNNADTSQKSALLTAFQKAVAAQAPNATGGLNQVGNVSSAYTKAAQNAALGVSQYTNDQATNLAGMDAPGLQRQQENADLAKYGSQIGGISQQSAGDNAVTDIQLRGVQQNPWLAAIGSAMTSYGKGGMGGMLGGGAAAGGGGVSYPDGLGGYGVNMPTY